MRPFSGRSVKIRGFLAALAAFLFAACSSAPVRNDAREPGAVSEYRPPARHRMLEAILTSVAVPYRPAGDDETGFDCSGFTRKIFADVLHVVLPRSAAEQYAFGRDVKPDRMEFGDLVFFQTEGNGPSHVGIYIGDGLFAHASVSRGVTISLLGAAYYRQRLYGVRRVVD